MNIIEEYFKKTKNPNKNELFELLLKTDLDINQHLPYLAGLASNCSHVTEMGTRFGVSTIGWLMGKPDKLVCYDKHPKKTIENIKKISNPTQFIFNKADTLEIEIEETDLLFIDTLHTYEQLKQELAFHHMKARKFIVMHDTESCGKKDGHGFTGPGLLPAIDEFLSTYQEWKTLLNSPLNNGLVVLIKH